MNVSIQNNNLDFNNFFPFYIKTSHELIIQEVGMSLSKVIPDCVGKALSEVFVFKRPWSVKHQYDSILEYSNQIFIMESLHDKLMYRWQVVELPNSKELLFIGTPWITSADLLVDYGITLNDFALHDSITDMFQLLRTHEINLNDIKELAEQLNGQKDLLQKVIDLVPHQIFLKDKNSRYKLANRSVANFFGIANESLIGKTDRDFVFLKEESELYINGDKKVVENGARIDIPEEPQTDREGNLHINHVVKMPFKFENGEVGVMGIAIDITQNKIAEQKLKESEDRYRKIVENASDIIYRSDELGRFTYVNNQAVTITGYSREELIGKRYLELVREDYIEKITDYYLSEDFLNAVDQSYYEFPISTKEGNEIWLGQKVQPLFADNVLIGYQAVVRDITLIKKLEFERLQTEDELRETASRLKSLIENLNAGILVEDEHRKIVAVNQSFCDIFTIPVPPNDMLGWDCSDSAEQSKHMFTNPDFFIQNINEILSKKAIVTGEELQMVSGKILQRDYIPIFVKNDYRGHLWYYKDVTEEFHTKEKINEQKRFYESILNKIPADVVVWDENHRYLFANPVSIKSPEIRKWIIGKDDFEYCAYRNKPIHLAEERRAKFFTIKNQKKDLEWEEKMKNQNGNEEYTLRKMTPIFDENGDFEMGIGYGINITERKQMEVELEKAKNLAEESLKAKEQFLSTMSHEIRTPMNAVIGMTQLLLNENPKPEQMEYLNAIRFSSDNLLNLINDILDFTKIESGKLEFEKIHFDIFEFIKKVQNTYRFQAEDKGLIFNNLIDPKVDRYLVGDTVRLNQILTNLVGNAIKFTEKGQILIKVSKTGSKKGFVKIRFEVADTGIGIEPSKVERIFERFTQANSDTTRKYGGTGLGLTITKLLVEQQGGKISVKSKPGKGTTFNVELDFEIGEKSKLRTESTMPLSKFRKFDGQKVLLVEDNKLNQVVASKFMAKWGLHVQIAENGRFAVEAVSNGSFDLILMDLQMPEMDGFQSTKHIRTFNKSIPIIALTASASIEVKSKVTQAGMNDYLSKPFEATAFYNKISSYLNLNEKKGKNQPVTQSVKNVKNLYNLDYYEQFSGGNKAFVEEMIQIFIEDTPPIVSELGKAIQAKKHYEIASFAHKLKTSLSLMGMDASKCIRLDEIGKNKIESWEEANDCFESIQIHVREVVKQLSNN
ncbi:MAG: PAS domain S-box protein [Bacteroidota bacterium]|nr:PAS domain S-box protein [Bacteroidota bacterium]